MICMTTFYLELFFELNGAACGEITLLTLLDFDLVLLLVEFSS